MHSHSIENPKEIEEYVETVEFEKLCLWESNTQGMACDTTPAEGSHESGSDDESVESDLGKLEACYYYVGVGRSYSWPTLIYRTSEDVYQRPCPPRKDALVVSETHEFAQDGLWDRVRNKVVELLDMRNIRFTSVDFVRFRSKDVGYPEVISNPTVWIGVVPNTLDAAGARESALDIRAYLDELKVQNIDIAYRESVAKFLSSHGPPLFHPVEERDPLKPVIDNVSVALSIPISGRKNSTQGTLGPYFQAGDKLYAITTRHNLFSSNEGNEEYRHSDSGPKRYVQIMGDQMFKAYLRSIRGHIATLIYFGQSYQRDVDRYKSKVEAGVDLLQSQAMLEELEAKLAKKWADLASFKEFYAETVKDWSSRKNRIIGFVAWSPPLGAGAAPHHYTCDLCVVELYKDKFKNMIGNFLSASPEDTFMGHWKSHPGQHFPCMGLAGLVALGGIVTMDQINDPTTTNTKRLIYDMYSKSEYAPRRVVKRGAKTNTTFGTLSRYMSHVRRYTLLGEHMDSLELPIVNFDGRSYSGYGDPFCEDGDSGSAVLNPVGEFVGLLNGGTSMGFSACDIGYATPFEWVWEQVSKEFPGAEMDFDNLLLDEPWSESPHPGWLLETCYAAREKQLKSRQ